MAKSLLKVKVRLTGGNTMRGASIIRLGVMGGWDKLWGQVKRDFKNY